MFTVFIVIKEGSVLFNNALNTFYLRLYGVRHMVKYHSDSERGNPLPPHGVLFMISSNGSLNVDSYLHLSLPAIKYAQFMTGHKYEGRKEIYLMTHLTHFIYGYMTLEMW